VGWKRGEAKVRRKPLQLEGKCVLVAVPLKYYEGREMGYGKGYFLITLPNQESTTYSTVHRNTIEMT
jgi:hypothetical protein